MYLLRFPEPTWFYRYVDDTLVIWPHEVGKLYEVLGFLNRTQPKIKFTMEMGKAVCLSFLDILVNRQRLNLLGHKVYHKTTQTDLYLNAVSHHHQAPKHIVLST